MSKECLTSPELDESTDRILEFACAPGVLEYLTSPSPGDVQSLGEAVRNYQLKLHPAKSGLGAKPGLHAWLAQILFD